MKNKKLKLEDLKVKSFVTSMEKQQKQTVDGGLTPSISWIVSTAWASFVSIIGPFVTDNICPPDDDTVYGGCVAATFKCTNGGNWQACLQ